MLWDNRINSLQKRVLEVCIKFMSKKLDILIDIRWVFGKSIQMYTYASK